MCPRMTSRLPLSAFRRGALAAGCLLGLAGRASAPDNAPPPAEYEFDGSAAGGCSLDGAAAPVGSGGSQSAALSALARQSLGAPGWYWNAGLRAENYFFSRLAGRTVRLQDYAVPLGVEYYRGAESVAALTLRPGWYFAGRTSGEAWDVPVDCAGGFPLLPALKLDGVAGFSNARFYHHALPIVGVVWTPDERWRAELVFPEPAVIANLGGGRSLRLGATLLGGGFRGRPGTPINVVEYDSYRIGADFSMPAPAGAKLTVGAGVETERSFDFFRQGRRLHGGGAGYLDVSLAAPR